MSYLYDIRSGTLIKSILYTNNLKITDVLNKEEEEDVLLLMGSTQIFIGNSKIFVGAKYLPRPA